MNHTGQSVLLLLYCKCCLFSFLHIYGATTYNIGSLETWLNLRFKMFRLSSSSTFGLWLSLLRRNTKTTFWTIFDSSCLSPVLFILFKPAVVSSLCAFSRGIPYVSISHPNRGCGAWAEALPTSGITDEEPNSLCFENSPPKFISRFRDAASQVQLTCCDQQLRHSSLLSASDYRRFSTGSWWAAGVRLPLFPWLLHA